MSIRSSQRWRGLSAIGKRTMPPSGCQLREDHLRASGSGAVLLEHELIPLPVDPDAGLRRQRPRRLGVTEREVVLLDRDDVREVGADLELELERERLGALVAQDQVILHPLADEALAGDRERVLREARDDRVTQVEGGGEVLDLPRGEQERSDPVDAELEPGEKARVLGEEPARLPVEVADLVAHAEGRPLEDRQAHRSVSRTTRAPLDCASALTTISSMFTCSGRVKANRTQSATSSGVTGSMPS